MNIFLGHQSYDLHHLDYQPEPPPPVPPPPVHLADFGLCELLDPSRTHVSNHNKGTPFYVAPETMKLNQVGSARCLDSCCVSRYPAHS